MIPATEDGDDTSSNWETLGPTAIPGPAYGQQVRIQWTFIGNGNNTYNGASIDDVLVERSDP